MIYVRCDFVGVCSVVVFIMQLYWLIYILNVYVFVL